MYINTTPISHHTNNDQMMSYNNACIQPKYHTTHPHIAQCVRQCRAWTRTRWYNQTNWQYLSSRNQWICTYTYVFYKKEEAHMQKRHNEDIMMYYYDRHFVVVDVWMPDDNTIHPHSSVICDTTLSKVHHIDVRDKVMKAMHMTTTT